MLAGESIIAIMVEWVAVHMLDRRATRLEAGRAGRKVLLLPRVRTAETEKGPRLHVAPTIFWLPDLDSNQGPAD
jgi:hypothetical protein